MNKPNTPNNPKPVSLPPPQGQSRNHQQSAPRVARQDERSAWDILQSFHRNDMLMHDLMRKMAADLELLSRKVEAARRELFAAGSPAVMPASPDEETDEVITNLANKFAAAMGR